MVFEQLPRESDKAFAAFREHLGMGPSAYSASSAVPSAICHLLSAIAYRPFRFVPIREIRVCYHASRITLHVSLFPSRSPRGELARSSH